MEEIDVRIMDLSSKEYYCGQIIMLLGQELRGTHNPELVKAMTGLAGGLYSGRVCGTLTGAACLIGTYVGKGSDEEERNALCNIMVYELVEWFEKEFTSTECNQLVSEDFNERLLVCPEIIKKTFLKVLGILENRGVDPYEGEN